MDCKYIHIVPCVVKEAPLLCHDNNKTNISTTGIIKYSIICGNQTMIEDFIPNIYIKFTRKLFDAFHYILTLVKI